MSALLTPSLISTMSTLHPASTPRGLSRRTLMAALALSAWARPGHAQDRAQPDANHLVRRADRARGSGLAGVAWQVQVSHSGEGTRGLSGQTLRVQANESASLAEVLDPPSSQGAKLLQAGRNMWMSKPGLRKPIAISPRQRLSGQAAIGDIAATYYARDYEAVLQGEDQVEGERCWLLELTARHKQATYDRIRYWVSVRSELAVRAEFLTPSGKLLKSARFEHGHSLSLKGQSWPFPSRMVIRDALSDAQTTLAYSQIEVKALPASLFDPANL